MTTDRHRDVVAQLPALLRYARSLTRNGAAAEDLVHDALVSALDNLDSYDAARAIRPWLFGILHNRFVSDRRHETVRQRHLSELEQLPADAGSPAQEQSVALRQVDLALAELPVNQREALHLVVVEGMSYQQAADAVGVPIGTIMSRISRARRRLRMAQDDAADAPVRLRIVGQEGQR